MNARTCPACGLAAAPGDRYCEPCGSAPDRTSWIDGPPALEPCVATVYPTGRPEPCGLPADELWIHANPDDSRAIDHEYEAPR